MTAGLKIYRVGGAVRDALLGLPVKDRDWVVVGATAQQMLDHGFRQVGRDFPVFLHPDTHEEYALARTERKTGRGYHGFIVHADPSVTIEEDLGRRDLTINAIAVDDDDHVVDPHHGRRDIDARLLRHVSEAFVEDPVRVLRVARFAARFPDFSVAPETLALMKRIATAGEIAALVPERVWQELAKGLMAPKPSRMIEVLKAADAWPELMPEFESLPDSRPPDPRTPDPRTPDQPVPDQPASDLLASDLLVPDLPALDRAAAADAPLRVRYAVLVAGLSPAAVDQIGERLRVPGECRDLAQALARVEADLTGLIQADPARLQQFLVVIDALRRPQRLADLIAVEALRERVPAFGKWRGRIEAAAAAAAEIDQATIARAAAATGPARGGEAIREAIQAAQVAAIAERLARMEGSGGPESGGTEHFDGRDRVDGQNRVDDQDHFDGQNHER